MKIDIWSDYVCPFCTVGEKNLSLALEKFEGAKDVEITWRSFQLDPSAPKDPDTTAVEHLVRTKNMPREQVEQMQESLAQRAAASGLTYNWQEAVMANTWDAHRVGHYARSQGLGNQWDERVKKAFFSEGGNVASHSELKALAQEIGLDAARVAEILAGDEYSTDVAQEIAMAHQIGVQGVPFFVFDGKYAVSGAQPVEMFQQALETASQG